MRDSEKKMCELILADATKVEIEECYADGTHIQFYTVTDDEGNVFNMTKHDGEWVYIFRVA